MSTLVWYDGGMKKLLVAGSRTFQRWPQGFVDGTIERAIESMDFVKPYVLIHGGARGVDLMAGRWAASRSIDCEVFPAQWDLFGKSAGYRRNAEMVDAADAVIVIWDGQSKGTRHTMNLAMDANSRKSFGLPFVFVSVDAEDVNYWEDRYV